MDHVRRSHSIIYLTHIWYSESRQVEVKLAGLTSVYSFPFLEFCNLILFHIELKAFGNGAQANYVDERPWIDRAIPRQHFFVALFFYMTNGEV